LFIPFDEKIAFEYELIMKKYKDACAKLIAAFQTLPESQQDDLRSQVRNFIEQKFLEAGIWGGKGSVINHSFSI
jgi:hypothetical protein